VNSPPVLDIIPWLWSGLEEKEVHTFLSLRVTFENSVIIVEAWVVVLQIEPLLVHILAQCSNKKKQVISLSGVGENLVYGILGE
jgi:hypothetical protein